MMSAQQKVRHRERAATLLRDWMEAHATELIDRMIDSGALDVDSFGDDYVLPKILACRVAQRAADALTPFAKEHRASLRNLCHFV